MARAGELLPALIRAARTIHRRELECKFAVLSAWGDLAGVLGWTPAMVDRVEREMRRLAVLVLTALALVGPARALTTVTDTLYDAQGNKANGRITIKWPGFTVPGPLTIVAGQLTVAASMGPRSVDRGNAFDAIPSCCPETGFN